VIEDDESPVIRKPSLDELWRTEWSAEFERLMRNRLIMGALRYGRMGAPDKPQYDRTGDIARRVEKFRATGNKELLVDIANLCMCEFVECDHPKAHFRATDDGEHTKKG
jgi:hypothetical protein